MPKRETGATPVPPAAARELSIKQQRDERRAAKVAVLKKQQKRAGRNRTLAIVGGSVAVLAIVGVIVTSVVTSGGGSSPVAAITGLKTFTGLTATHVDSAVDYAQTPPVGGDHYAQWLNCGVYTEPVPNENTVHVLEHGAVWVTYNPTTVTGSDLATLQGEVPSTFSVLSPWPDLDAPVVISAWGAQVKLDGVNDPRLAQFVTKYWQSPAAPEPGAPCTGGVDGPGRIS